MFHHRVSGARSGEKKGKKTGEFHIKVHVVAHICATLHTSETKPVNFHARSFVCRLGTGKSKEALSGFAAGCFPDGLLTTRTVLLFVSNAHSYIFGIAFLDK